MEHRFSWVDCCNIENIDTSNCEILSFSKATRTIAGMDREYFIFILLPLVLMAVIKGVEMVAKVKNSQDALVAIGCLLFGFCVIGLSNLIFHRKRITFLKTVQEKTKGREIIVGKKCVYISCGELIRGESNAYMSFRSDLGDYALMKGAEYFFLSPETCSSISHDKDSMLIASPKNQASPPFRVSLKPWRNSPKALSAIEAVAKSWSN